MSVYMITTDRGEVFAVSDTYLDSAKCEIRENTIGEVVVEVDGPYDYVELDNPGVRFEPQKVDK